MHVNAANNELVLGLTYLFLGIHKVFDITNHSEECIQKKYGQEQ